MLSGPGRRWMIVALGSLLIAGLFVWGLRRSDSWVDRVQLPEKPARVVLSAEQEARIEAFCGNCHAVPRPESFPRDMWHAEVMRGYEFYARSGFTHLDPPPVRETVESFSLATARGAGLSGGAGCPATAGGNFFARATVDRDAHDCCAGGGPFALDHIAAR